MGGRLSLIESCTYVYHNVQVTDVPPGIDATGAGASPAPAARASRRRGVGGALSFGPPARPRPDPGAGWFGLHCQQLTFPHTHQRQLRASEAEFRQSLDRARRNGLLNLYITTCIIGEDSEADRVGRIDAEGPPGVPGCCTQSRGSSATSNPKWAGAHGLETHAECWIRSA